MFDMILSAVLTTATTLSALGGFMWWAHKRIVESLHRSMEISRREIVGDMRAHIRKEVEDIEKKTADETKDLYRRIKEENHDRIQGIHRLDRELVRQNGEIVHLSERVNDTNKALNKLEFKLDEIDKHIRNFHENTTKKIEEFLRRMDT